MEQGTIHNLIAERHNVPAGMVRIEVTSHGKDGVRVFRANTPRGFFIYHVFREDELSLEMFNCHDGEGEN